MIAALFTAASLLHTMGIFSYLRSDLPSKLVDSVDEDGAKKFARYLPLTLTNLPVPIGSGTVLDIEDTACDRLLTVTVCHDPALAREEHSCGFVVEAEPDCEAEANGKRKRS